jgi:hypothetical protein
MKEMKVTFCPLKPKLVFMLFKNSVCTSKTLHHYKDQVVNAVQGNNICLYRETKETHEYKRAVTDY